MRVGDGFGFAFGAARSGGLGFLFAAARAGGWRLVATCDRMCDLRVTARDGVRQLIAGALADPTKRVLRLPDIGTRVITLSHAAGSDAQPASGMPRAAT